MQKAHSPRGQKRLALAMAIAAIGLTACGGSDNKSSSNTGLKYLTVPTAAPPGRG